MRACLVYIGWYRPCAVQEQPKITVIQPGCQGIRTSQALGGSVKLVLLYFSARWCGACIEFDNVIRDVGQNKKKRVKERQEKDEDVNVASFINGYKW